MKKCKAKGGKLVSGNPKVAEEAKKRAAGGRMKKAGGGGSDKSPFSSAAKMSGRSDATSH